MCLHYTTHGNNNKKIINSKDNTKKTIKRNPTTFLPNEKKKKKKKDLNTRQTHTTISRNWNIGRKLPRTRILDFYSAQTWSLKWSGGMSIIAHQRFAPSATSCQDARKDHGWTGTCSVSPPHRRPSWAPLRCTETTHPLSRRSPGAVPRLRPTGCWMTGCGKGLRRGGGPCWSQRPTGGLLGTRPGLAWWCRWACPKHRLPCLWGLWGPCSWADLGEHMIESFMISCLLLQGAT